MERYDFLIVGAGFAGCVLAERLASIGKKILLIDKRKHLGGNCYDYLEDGIYVQKYGPHIFHTKNKIAYDYLSKFTKWNNYKHKVIAFYNEDYYPIPINLETVNKFYKIKLKNEKQLKEFLEKKIAEIDKIKFDLIKNSEEVVVSKFGRELYEAFIKNYTKKQWDKYPEELDRFVLERLPIKYNKNPYYFVNQIQGMPKEGFTHLIKKMVSNKKIKIELGKDFFDIKNKVKYDKLIYTGPIDRFFKYKYGKLKYRALKFKFIKCSKESFQPNSVINFPEDRYKFSRITEFKKFYKLKKKNTIICKEFFSWKGEPCYPVMDKSNLKLLEKYKKASQKIKKVYFIGRLAQYKYLNMDEVVLEALSLFEKIAKEKQ